MNVLRAVEPRVLFQEYQACGNSISALLKKYDIGSHNPARKYIQKLFLEHFNFKTSRSILDRMMVLGKERIEKEVSVSNTVSDVLKNLGFKDIRANRLHFSTVCKALAIPHPKYNRKFFCSVRKWHSENLFKDFSNSTEQLPSNHSLKLHFLKKMAPDINNCKICNISNVWENKTLVLQLDHIDGNKKNNLLSNLRLVCPNCHSQTDTFVRKNTLMHSVFTNKRELPCKNVIVKQFKRKVAKISEQQLLDDLKIMSFSKIGAKYGVSDNAVRKWVRGYGYNPKTIKQTLKTS